MRKRGEARRRRGAKPASRTRIWRNRRRRCRRTNGSPIPQPQPRNATPRLAAGFPSLACGCPRRVHALRPRKAMRLRRAALSIFTLASRRTLATMAAARWPAPTIPDAIIEPLQGPASSAVIFMHGLGDTSEGWQEVVADALRGALPGARFILPTAATQPVTVNGGAAMPSWYDIKSLSRSRALEDCAGLDESAARVRALVDAQAAAGVPRARIVLAGFSQGGALALFTALTDAGGPGGAEPLGGAFALSGYLPRERAIAPAPAVAARTRLRLFHGDADGVVPHDAADATLARAHALGVADARLFSYAGLAHGSRDDELRDVARELRALLAPRPAAADIERLGVKALKELLAGAGVPRARVAACVEKDELVALAKEALM